MSRSPNSLSQILLGLVRIAIAIPFGLVAIAAAQLTWHTGQVLYIKQQDPIAEYYSTSFIIGGFWLEPHQVLWGGSIVCIFCLVTMIFIVSPLAMHHKSRLSV